MELIVSWVVFASCITFVAAATFIWTTININALRSTMGEIQDSIDTVVAKLDKVEGEVVASGAALQAEIASLKDQLANVPGAEKVDLTGLEAVAQRLDDLNPDAAE